MGPWEWVFAIAWPMICALFFSERSETRALSAVWSQMRTEGSLRGHTHRETVKEVKELREEVLHIRGMLQLRGLLD